MQSRGDPMPYLVTLTPCITRLFILPKTEFYTKIAIAANVEKGGKVDGVKEIWYIDEGEQEVKLVRHPELD